MTSGTDNKIRFHKGMAFRCILPSRSECYDKTCQGHRHIFLQAQGRPAQFLHRQERLLLPIHQRQQVHIVYRLGSNLSLRLRLPVLLMW